MVGKIDEEVGARALAAAIVKFAAETGSCVVAEGVETTKELDVLKSLKVTLAQGYLLGRPDSFAKTIGRDNAQVPNTTPAD